MASPFPVILSWASQQHKLAPERRARRPWSGRSGDWKQFLGVARDPGLPSHTSAVGRTFARSHELAPGSQMLASGRSFRILDIVDDGTGN
jgi:hypothetical protein